MCTAEFEITNQFEHHRSSQSQTLHIGKTLASTFTHHIKSTFFVQEIHNLGENKSWFDQKLKQNTSAMKNHF